MGLIHAMNLAGFDLNLLLVFHAMMTERHATRAGHRIGLSQPAVSAALNRLRSIFDDELFIRQSGEMVPTPRALSLAEPIREALQRVEAALARTSTLPRCVVTSQSEASTTSTTCSLRP